MSSESEPSNSSWAATHAGGIVWRRSARGLEFLLVGSTASRDANAPEWVLPKGHIEAGEGPAEAALREVYEESGVVAKDGPRVGEVRYTAKGEDVRCALFAMELEAQGETGEDRPSRWATLDEVRACLRFPATVALIERAAAMVATTPA